MPAVEGRGPRIHFEALGEGRPLVLGHSFLCSGDMWAPQVAALSRGHRVINVDARGHGRSARIEEEFTLYDMVDDVVSVLDACGVERAVWAGLSVGGMVALRAALVARERVEALVLLDTDAGPETAWRRFQYGALGGVARTLGIRPVLPTVTRRMFGTTTRREKPELVAEWRRRFTEAHVPSALRMLGALRRRDDLRGRLREIGVPTLVVVGAEDSSLPPARSRVIADGIPGAKLVEIPAAGHLSTLEKPAAVTEALQEFLGSLDGGRAPAD